MSTRKSSCFAPMLALALLFSGIAANVSAQETLANIQTEVKTPFEISEQNCIEQNWMDSICVTITDEFIARFGSKGLCKIVDGLESTIDRFRAKNGWGKEVTCDTPLEVGYIFAFS